jgi:hypothetical protein
MSEKCKHNFEQYACVKSNVFFKNCNQPDQTCYRICAKCKMREIDFDYIKQLEAENKRYRECE